MVFGRLGKKVRTFLGRDGKPVVDLEQLRQERRPLVLDDQEFFFMFKLATADLEEVREAARVQQKQRAGEALVDHFRDRIRPKYFVHHATSDSILEPLREYRRACQKVYQEAEMAMQHRFAPLGGEAFEFESSIDWFSDFEGRSWVYAHVEDLKRQLHRPNDPASPEMGAVEVTWEFNRHGHFVDMARAYWLSGAEALASEFIVQAVDWTERNPALTGINWLCPVTIASRAVNWTQALHFFLKSPQVQSDAFTRILKELTIHGLLMADDLPRLRGRERLAVSSSLIQLALAFPELNTANQWYQLGGQHLAEAAWEVMGQDGWDFTGSTAQHRGLIEWLLMPLVLCRSNKLEFPEGVRQAAETALDSLALLTPANGLAPQFGEGWSNRFLGRHCGPARHGQRLLALGSVLLGRRFGPVLKEMPAELYWWMGIEAPALFRAVQSHQPSLLHRAFPAAGLATVRDGWGDKATWCSLRGMPSCSLAEAAPPIPAQLPFHDDALSFCLSLAGEPVLAEPGGPALLDQIGEAFARVSCHSAPRIGREREPLCLSRKEKSDSRVLLNGDSERIYLGAHRDVWLMPDRPWKLWREILFMPDKKRVAIRDSLDGEGEVHLESNLLLAPHLDVLMRGDMGCLLRGKSLQARLVPIFPARFRYDLKRGSMKPFGGWVWAESGKPTPAHRLRYFMKIKAPFKTYLWLVWDPNDTKVPREEDLDRWFDESAP